MKKMIALLLCGLILAGCTQPAAPSEPTDATILTTPAPTDAPTEPPTESATDAPTEPATQAPTEPEPTTVTIYYGNENYDGFETAEVQVDEVSMNVLVDKLIEAGVLTDDIGIWAMQIDGTCLRLTFSPTFGDLIRAQGTAGEYIIMGSVVNTFLDAFDAESVYITVADDILESGHQVYDYELTFYD